MLFLIILGLLSLFYWFFVPSPYIVRGVHIASHDVGMLTPQQAQQTLQQQIASPDDHELVVSWQQKQWATPSASLHWQYNWDEAVNQAYSYGHEGSIAKRLQQRFNLLWEQPNINLEKQYNQQLLTKWLQTVATQINQTGELPTAVVQEQTYFLTSGTAGFEVQLENLIDNINHHPDQHQFSIPVKTTLKPLTPSQQEQAEERLKKLWGSSIKVHVSELEPDFSWTASDFFSWLELPTGYRPEVITQDLKKLNEQYQTEAQNAELTIEDNQVTKFIPHRSGRSIAIEETTRAITKSLEEIEATDTSSTSLDLAFKTVAPQKTLAETNKLGINELLGVGTSTFFGSIPNRVYNVNLTSERLHMTLVEPDAEFSFNQSVGEVSSRTGYKSAYIISNGRTQLGDGGGVCQVSTTTFRAALDAGFSITAWRPHSYRVGYYEQNEKPGFDATVYAPTTDFRFKNDTGHHIVIASYAQPDDRFMRVEIWGTKDGRQSTISNYQMYNRRPAPAPLYQPDPSLPQGVQKQIDWSSPGATTSFDYTVQDKNGETIYNKTFKSVYQPWQAVYLVGTS